MLRRDFLGAMLALGPVAVQAQQPQGPKRIGLLWVGASSSNLIGWVREALRTRGYVEGKHVQLKNQYLVERYDQLPDAAARLIREGVDVILCYGATACTTVAKATSTIPIVGLGIGSDPVRLGLAESFAKPGRNFTGITLSADLGNKRLELLHQVARRSRRIGVILSPLSSYEVSMAADFRSAAQALGLEMVQIDIRSPEDIEPVIQDVPRLRVDALALIGSSMLSANRQRLVHAINRLRLPAIYAGDQYVDAGGLLSYSVSLEGVIFEATGYVDKILKGAHPSTLPIEQTSRYELVVNLVTAREQGITIPEEIVQRADRVIQ